MSDRTNIEDHSSNSSPFFSSLEGFDKKPTITVLHQLIRNGNAFLRVKGQREHVSIIGKALKPPKAVNGLGATKTTDRTLSKHVKILLSPASPNAYMRVALSCRYPHVEVLISRSTTLAELIDRLTQYWQLTNQAQSVRKTVAIGDRHRCPSFSVIQR